MKFLAAVVTVHVENPAEEVWRRLRLLADETNTADYIARMRTISPRNADVRKQARQVGYCIRQAEEYFTAAREVRLPTRPLLLYYGASSLSHALVLLRGDGEVSFDALRKKKRHRHHGLELTQVPGGHQYSDGPRAFFASVGVDAVARETKESRPSALTPAMRARLLSGDEFEPWGAFPLFYLSLRPPAFMREITEVTAGSTFTLTRYVPQPSADVLPFTRLLEGSLPLDLLLSGLPDLYSVLPTYGWAPDLCRGSYRTAWTNIVERSDDGPERLLRREVSEDFLIDGCTDDQRAALVEFYARTIPRLSVANDTRRNLHFKCNFAVPAGEQEPNHYHPDMVDDLGGRMYYITKPDRYVVEPAAHYAILFGLGMLARYYPDIWMRAIDSDARIAGITDAFLAAVLRKFPLLLLDQLSGLKHVIRS